MSVLKYKIGEIFMVPLRDQGLAAGVVARMNGKGIIYGYFWGPRLFSIDNLTPEKLIAENAILVGKFGDLAIQKGLWPLVGSIEEWDLEKWPLHPMIRVDEKLQKGWLTHYSSDLAPLKEEEEDPRNIDQYPYDRLMGYGSVEIRLTKLLNSSNHPQ